jgi:PhnB protein
MARTENTNATITASIAPWLSISKRSNPVAFYKTAFGAVETYRLEDPGGGIVTRLAVDTAEFWVSEEDGVDKDVATYSLGGGSVRMILTVANPDALFAQALAAGATEIFPVGEEYGWRLGRLADPFGLHWEIGHMLATKEHVE